MKLKVLLVEDDERDVETCRGSIKVLQRKYELEVELISTKTLKEAIALLDNSFDGAIVDLKLKAGASSTESYEGNEVITKIQRDYRIPVAILTGTPEQADDLSFEFLGVFKKGEMSYETLLTRFISIYKTGLTKIVGGRGRIEQAMNDVFWRNLLPNINSWEDLAKTGNGIEDALLRFTINHLFEIIDHNSGSCLPEEMYISPPVSDLLKTGSIVKCKNANDYYIVLSPACDLAIRGNGICKTDRILVCEIDDFPSVRDKIIEELPEDKRQANRKRRKIEELLKNNYKIYYHWLPAVKSFPGGIINFRKTSSYTAEDFSSIFLKPSCQISSHFIKDIIARYSSFYARQGQPDFAFGQLAKTLAG